MALTREAPRTQLRVAGVERPHGKLAPGPGRVASEVAAHQCARIHSALIDLIVQRGYAAVKVRDLVELAGVSTRAFYEHFEGKEDCLLRTYEHATRRAIRHIIAAQVGERDWRERLRLVFVEFLRGLASEPYAARFVLIEIYQAGPAALAQARRAESTFAGLLGESLARAPGGIAVPPLIVEAMVAGVAHVARARLLADREAELVDLADELVEWALRYPGRSTAALAELDLQTVWRNTAFEAAIESEKEAWSLPGDRAVILSAVADRAVAQGYGSLTVARIRAGTGVSRKTFQANFEGVEDCFLAALEERAGRAFGQAARAQAAARTWAGGIYRAIAAICDQVAADPLLATVCLADDFGPGSSGARRRRRLASAAAEQLSDSVPSKLRTSPIAAEASAGAIWSLFHHHVVRDWGQHRKVAATLTFLALAPAIGASSAQAAIRREQTA